MMFKIMPAIWLRNQSIVFSKSQVIPSLRRMGIGRMIVQRLIRLVSSPLVWLCLWLMRLTFITFQGIVISSEKLAYPPFRRLYNKGIYDISALCSEEEQ